MENLVQEVVFKKGQILKSKKYADVKDILATVLEDDKSYSEQEIEDRLKGFKKGLVK